MATKSEAFFHDKWLGHVQTASDGLVVAKPVLLEAGCAQHQPPEVQETLRELCPPGPDDAPRHITDLMQFFQRLLDFDLDLFDAQSAIPDAVALYAPEGPQTIRPTFGLLRQDDPEPPEGAGSPAANAAARYVALLWDVTGSRGWSSQRCHWSSARQARNHHRQLVVPGRRQVRPPASALSSTDWES